MRIDKKLMGQAIAKLRTMRGLTQHELNEMCEMSTISHIEQGLNTVSFNSLNKIAEALEVPAACITLLGSNIGKDDKLMLSLRSLALKTIEFNEQIPQSNQKS